MKIKIYNTETKEENILHSFDAKHRGEVREIVMALRLQLMQEITEEDGYWYVAYKPKKFKVAA